MLSVHFEDYWRMSAFNQHMNKFVIKVITFYLQNLICVVCNDMLELKFFSFNYLISMILFFFKLEVLGVVYSEFFWFSNFLFH